VRVANTPAPIAARLHASAAVSLNMALNNDINARACEILSASGCLLTDQLQLQSGMEMCFVNENILLDAILVSWRVHRFRRFPEVGRSNVVSSRASSMDAICRNFP
jgi:hypothetical protein